MTRSEISIHLNNAKAKIEAQAKDIIELERVKAEQRVVIDGLFRQAELRVTQNEDAEDRARMYYAQSRSLQSDLNSLVAVINSEFDIAYCLWTTAPSKPLEARMDTLGSMLSSLKLLDKFNAPRWRDIKAQVEDRG